MQQPSHIESPRYLNLCSSEAEISQEFPLKHGKPEGETAKCSRWAYDAYLVLLMLCWRRVRSSKVQVLTVCLAIIQKRVDSEVRGIFTSSLSLPQITTYSSAQTVTSAKACAEQT